MHQVVTSAAVAVTLLIIVEQKQLKRASSICKEGKQKTKVKTSKKRDQYRPYLSGASASMSLK